jgi:bifunctional DNA-binding transcriptional regulator/antitoxin component of YhaV-PrlF toxin-antitoxin module
MERFEARLVRPEGTGTWTYVDLPGDVSARLGKPARLPVRGTVAGRPVRSTLMVGAGGSRYLVVPRELRDAADVEPGDVVAVELEPDPEPRTVEAPPDLREALERSPGAAAAFARLANSHRKAYVDWIEEAKRPETRERRVAKAVEMISEGKRLKG